MKRTFILPLSISGLALVACSAPDVTVCDRDAQVWDKVNTAEDVCYVAPAPIAIPLVSEPPVSEPPVSEPPVSEPPTPADPTKGNNGHGNGDQDAPGNSEDHNGAENSDHSGQGNSRGGKGRGQGRG